MAEASSSPSPVSPVIGVIGGSGVYDIEGLTDTQWRAVETPFGRPSDELLFGKLAGQPVVFLPRHGTCLIRRKSTIAPISMR